MTHQEIVSACADARDALNRARAHLDRCEDLIASRECPIPALKKSLGKPLTVDLRGLY